MDRPWFTYLVTRRHESNPFSDSAPLKMVSAVPVSAIDMKPHRAALMFMTCSSVRLPLTASMNFSWLIVSMSHSSAHSRTSLRSGALEMMWRSSLPFHWTPPLTPSNRNSD